MPPVYPTPGPSRHHAEDRQRVLGDLPLPSLRGIRHDDAQGRPSALDQDGSSAPVTTRHVSRAMSSSSSVGITHSSTSEPSASKRPSVPTSASLRAASTRTP